MSEQKAKSLGITDVKGAHDNISDLEVFGNGDTFQLICKASSEAEGWMKSTKAMEIPHLGCVVQVTTQQRNPDGSYAIAEALAYVPGARIVEDQKGVERGEIYGRRLEAFPMVKKAQEAIEEGLEEGERRAKDT